LIELVEGRLATEHAEAARAHLDACATGRELVAESAKYCHQIEEAPGSDEVPTGATLPARSGRRPLEPTVHPGRAVGRYVVRDVIGSGGMAVVYRAHDPQLGRQVALKLVRADRRAARDWQLRLLREARAMAQLSHPNVVHVYDAGMVDDQVFLAMELVEGRTLDAWRRECPRSPAEVVAAFLEAGRGLAAAHAANLVHRDFKPSNVLVSHDGRVRVTDFGLARNAMTSMPAFGEEPAEVLPSVTRTGMVVGTPEYMAPEQLLGQATDGRTDQFGFCVALFEFLFGERPSVEATPAPGPLASAIALPLRQRALGSPAANLYPVLARGLRLDPGERHPSMEALLAELAAAAGARTPVAARRRRVMAVAGAAAATAAAAVIATLALWPGASPPAQAIAPPPPAQAAMPEVAAPPAASPREARVRVAARPPLRRAGTVARASVRAQRPTPPRPDADALKPFGD
jgi:hypothetical protein